MKEKLDGDATNISGVRVIDDHTIEMTIDEAKSYFLAKLTYPTAFVLDQENVEASPRNWFREPNGTGPFRLQEYRVGETLVLGRNEHFHLGPPMLVEVEFHPQRRNLDAHVRERRDPRRGCGPGRPGPPERSEQ